MLSSRPSLQGHPGLTPDDVEGARARLRETLAANRAKIDKAVRAIEEAGADTSQDDIHHAIIQRSERLCEEIEEALARIDEGTYGVCDGCGAPIQAERLEAVPHAATCGACALATAAR